MPELTTYTEKALFLRIASGDEIAFAQFYRSYSATIFNTAMVYIKDADTAQDIVQTVFIRLWSKQASLADVDNPGNFLFILTRNIIFDHFKKAALRKKIQVQASLHKLYPDQVNDTAQRLEEHEYDKLLDTAIAKLPPRQRQVYILYHNGGFSYEEIADKLQLSKLTIKKHLELARSSVRHFVGIEYLQSSIAITLLADILLP